MVACVFMLFDSLLFIQTSLVLLLGVESLIINLKWQGTLKKLRN